MDGVTLVIDRKNLTVCIDGLTIRINNPDKTFQRVPLSMIQHVIVVGNPTVSCDVWRALAGRHIPAVLLPLRGGGFPAFVGNDITSSTNHRIGQYRAFFDNRCTMDIAKSLVHDKLTGQSNVLKKLEKRLPDIGINVENESIQSILVALITARDRDQVMGYEGAAAVCYFRGLVKVFNPKWKFSGRNRRPPRDPINALLSLSYTMGEQVVLSSIYQNGLDPSLGFLHTPQPSRYSLVLDLLEPLRPAIDLFVIRVLDLMTLKHFTINAQDGCSLNKEGRGLFFKSWSSWAMSSTSGTTLAKKADAAINNVKSFFQEYPAA